MQVAFHTTPREFPAHSGFLSGSSSEAFFPFFLFFLSVLSLDFHELWCSMMSVCSKKLSSNGLH